MSYVYSRSQTGSEPYIIGDTLVIPAGCTFTLSVDGDRRLPGVDVTGVRCYYSGPLMCELRPDVWSSGPPRPAKGAWRDVLPSRGRAERHVAGGVR